VNRLGIARRPASRKRDGRRFTQPHFWIVDYHYLGDPIEATSRQPKALDEVMALYSGNSG